MKRGRPTRHTKAKWVTFTNDGKELFFELDDKGNIIREGKSLIPHHTNIVGETQDAVPTKESPQTPLPVVIKIDFPVSAEPIDFEPMLQIDFNMVPAEPIDLEPAPQMFTDFNF